MNTSYEIKQVMQHKSNLSYMTNSVTLARQLLKKPADQDLHCLQFYLNVGSKIDKDFILKSNKSCNVNVMLAV